MCPSFSGQLMHAWVCGADWYFGSFPVVGIVIPKAGAWLLAQIP